LDLADKRSFKAAFLSTLLTTFFPSFLPSFFASFFSRVQQAAFLVVDELLTGVVVLSIFRAAGNHFQNSNGIKVSRIFQPGSQFARLQMFGVL
jgi:hypothetical protein